MQSRYEEFGKIDQLLDLLDEKSQNRSLTKIEIEKAQKMLDALEKKYIDDPNLKDETYKLYELQGVIHELSGDAVKAGVFIADAYKMMPKDAAFRTLSASKIYGHDAKLPEPMQDEQHEQSEEKLVGWLAIYALRLIVISLFFLYDFFLSLSEANSGDYSVDLESYFNVAALTDLVTFALAVSLAFLFFSKSKSTITLAKIFEGLVALQYFVFGAWLSSLYVKYDVVDDGEVGELYTYGLIALLWVLYWFMSKRVKRTFLN